MKSCVFFFFFFFFLSVLPFVSSFWNKYRYLYNSLVSRANLALDLSLMRMHMHTERESFGNTTSVDASANHVIIRLVVPATKTSYKVKR